jgi:hypothetical protein
VRRCMRIASPTRCAGGIGRGRRALSDLSEPRQDVPGDAALPIAGAIVSARTLKRIENALTR